MQSQKQISCSPALANQARVWRSIFIASFLIVSGAVLSRMVPGALPHEGVTLVAILAALAGGLALARAMIANMTKSAEATQNPADMNGQADEELSYISDQASGFAARVLFGDPQNGYRVQVLSSGGIVKNLWYPRGDGVPKVALVSIGDRTEKVLVTNGRGTEEFVFYGKKSHSGARTFTDEVLKAVSDVVYRAITDSTTVGRTAWTWESLHRTINQNVLPQDEPCTVEELSFLLTGNRTPQPGPLSVDAFRERLGYVDDILYGNFNPSLTAFLRTEAGATFGDRVYVLVGRDPIFVADRSKARIS